MHEKLNSKRYLRLVTTTKDSPLGLNERLTYSALLTNSDGMTQEGISSVTGLDAKGTVAAALEALLGHGLAACSGRRWVGLEPVAQRSSWFSTGPGDKRWERRLAFTKLFQRSPACPLSVRQNVVYSLLLS